MTRQIVAKTPPDAEEKALALADVALGAAGHEVTDPVARDIWARRVRGEITSEEGIAEIMKLVRAGHFKS